MPIKFSQLDGKSYETASKVVGLWSDETSATGLSNCIIDVQSFASKAELNSLNDRAVHKSGDETIYGDKTFKNLVKVDNNVEVTGTIRTTTMYGTAEKAISDSENNNIINTYATKEELEQKSTFTLFHDKWFDHQLNDPSWLRADEGSWHNGTKYTNAYEHLLNDIDGKSLKTKTVYKSSNITATGDLSNNKGLLSGFTGKTIFATHSAVKPTTSFEYVVKCKMGTLIANKSILQSSATKRGIILRVINATTGQVNVWVGDSTGAWKVSNVNTNCPITANIWMWYKLAWDGSTFTVSSSTDGVNFTQGLSQALTVAPDWDTNKSQCLGGCTWEDYPFTAGIIDLNECYLKIDGELYWSGCNYDTVSYYEADDGHLIAPSSSESVINRLYDNGDLTWYYIIDTQTSRFKLPKVKNRKIIDSSYNNGNWYRLYADKWLEQGGVATINYTAITNLVEMSIPYRDTEYSINLSTGGFVGSGVTSASWQSKSVKSFIIYGDYSASGGTGTFPTNWEAKGYTNIDLPYDGENYHYFYVGQFTGSALSQSAGLNEELFNNKADRTLRNIPSNYDYIVKCKKPTYQDTSWYRLYKSGWVEQGGTIDGNNGTSGMITFPIQMRDVNYSWNGSTGNNATNSFFILNAASRTITTVPWIKSAAAVVGSWEIRGYAADYSDDEGGESEFVFGDTYKTYFYSNMPLDYENSEGPMTPDVMATFEIPKAGVILGYLDPTNALAVLKINDKVVSGLYNTPGPVYISVDKNDVFSYENIQTPSTATYNQLWFVPYKEPEESNNQLVINIMNAIYPVGSIYIGTTVNCPIETIVGRWQKIDGDLVLQSSSTSHPVGSVIPPGLPNITGSMSIVTGGEFNQNGAISAGGSGNQINASVIGGGNGIVFDASHSNPIYGSANTVQPPAYIVNIWRRVE